MDTNLIEVAKENPDLIVSLKLGELLEFGQSIASTVKETQLTQEPTKKEENGSHAPKLWKSSEFLQPRCGDGVGITLFPRKLATT